jgi:hypothetical protein
MRKKELCTLWKKRVKAIATEVVLGLFFPLDKVG